MELGYPSTYIPDSFEYNNTIISVAEVGAAIDDALVGAYAIKHALTSIEAVWWVGSSSTFIPDQLSFYYPIVAYSFIGGSCGNGISSGYTTFNIYWDIVGAWYVEITLYLHTRWVLLSNRKLDILSNHRW